QLLPEAAAVQQLHHEERPPFAVEVVIEDRNDIRMPQLRARAALAQEALACAPVARKFRADDLQRDVVAEQAAPRAKDGAHAAFGKQFDDLVPSVQDRSGGEHPPDDNRCPWRAYSRSTSGHRPSARRCTAAHCSRSGTVPTWAIAGMWR